VSEIDYNAVLHYAGGATPRRGITVQGQNAFEVSDAVIAMLVRRERARRVLPTTAEVVLEDSYVEIP
jgi:hypothetical protein